MWSGKQPDTSESILDDDVFPLDVGEHPLPEITVTFRLFAALFHQSLCPSLAADEQGVVVQRTRPETGHPHQNKHEQGAVVQRTHFATGHLCQGRHEQGVMVHPETGHPCQDRHEQGVVIQ